MFFLDPNGPLSRSVRDGARVSLSCYSGPADRGVCQVGAVESGSSSVTASRLESYLSRLSVLFTRASRPQNGCPPPTSHQLSSEEGGENEDEEEEGRRRGKKRKRRREGARGREGEVESREEERSPPGSGAGASPKPPALSPPSLSENASLVGTGRCRL